MKLHSIVFALGCLAPLIGCDFTDEESSAGTDGSSDGGASGDGASGDGASGDEPSTEAVEGCRGACDNLQFFDCIDGSTHETCWNACAARSDSDLELFESCVNNSSPSCDPDCLESLLDASEPEPEPETTTTTGADSSGCVDACQAYIDAGCELELLDGVVSCSQVCATLSAAEQAAVAVCFSNPQTCEVDAACVEEDVEEEETGGADESGG